MDSLPVISIVRERADSADAIALIQELEDVLDPLYPSESRHGYGVEKMLREGVDFYVLREGDMAAACGGIQFFGGIDAGAGNGAALRNGGAAYGELKRMFVRPACRGRGYAKRVLQHLTDVAASRGVHVLRLETGVHQVEAIGLYEGVGFGRIGPFGPYTDDPLSVYYEKQLEGA